MGNKNYPKGYGLSEHQKFTYETANNFLEKYCEICTKLKGCEIQKNLYISVEEDYEEDLDWHDSLLAISPINQLSELEEKIICEEFENPQLKLSLQSK